MENAIQEDQTYYDLNALRLFLVAFLFQIYYKISIILRNQELEIHSENNATNHSARYPHLFAFDTLLSISGQSYDSHEIVR